MENARLNKLAHCRHCGESVSKTASTCPYCGARYPNKNWYIIQLLSAILLFFFGLYFIMILSDASFPTDSYYQTVSPIKISAEELWRAFKYDRTYAVKTLDDKIITVTGIVAEQTTNFMMHPCVLLENGEGSIPDGIFIMFPDGFDVFQYCIGEEITVTGLCSPAIHLAGDDTDPTIFVYIED